MTIAIITGFKLVGRMPDLRSLVDREAMFGTTAVLAPSRGRCRARSVFVLWWMNKPCAVRMRRCLCSLHRATCNSVWDPFVASGFRWAGSRARAARRRGLPRPSEVADMGTLKAAFAGVLVAAAQHCAAPRPPHHGQRQARTDACREGRRRATERPVRCAQRVPQPPRHSRRVWRRPCPTTSMMPTRRRSRH